MCWSLWIPQKWVLLCEHLASWFHKKYRPCRSRRLWAETCLLLVNPFFHISEHIEKKSFRKTLWKKVKFLKLSNFTFFHNVFYAVCILKCFNSRVSVLVCSFFKFGMISSGVLGNGLI